MPDNMMTITFEGNVPLGLFAEGMSHFQSLVDALSAEVVQGAAIEWIVDDLQSGSTVATIRGESAEPESVERVVSAYAIVGRFLQNRQPIPYSDKVARHARALTSILDGRVTAIRFETDSEETLILSRSASQQPNRLNSYGAVEGRVETLSRRRGLRFALYDNLYNRAVTCELNEGQEGLMRDAWGRRAIVEGWVSRDPVTGRPVAVHRVSNVVILPEVKPGQYRRARAVAPIGPDDPMPEEVVRRMRDA